MTNRSDIARPRQSPVWLSLSALLVAVALWGGLTGVVHAADPAATSTQAAPSPPQKLASRVDMAAGSAAVVTPETRYSLPDSTLVESWTLANGLRVVTRHVPLGSAIAITLAFDTGERDDPPNRAGLTRALAKLLYFGPTAIEPERTREQMHQLRPAGWDLQVTTLATRLSEVATLGQFPGVLHQMAARLAGVEPTEADLRAAIESVRQDLAANYRDSLDRVMVYRTRAMAEGLTDDAIAQRAAGAALTGLSLKEARERLARLGTRQAVLSVAGDLSSFPIRALIENEFGKLPASAATPARLRRPLAPGQRSTLDNALGFPLATVGVIAPALADTMHPEFYASSLRLGAFMLNKWGRPEPPFTSRFKSLLFDDPELALYFPPLTVEGLTIPQMREEFTFAAADAFFADLPPNMHAAILRGVDWLLGGPMPPEVLGQARGGGGVLLTLSSTAATRTLWGDPPFWSAYRRRFERALAGERADWKDYFQDPSHQVEMVMIPRAMR